jgi:hypothetical protein
MNKQRQKARRTNDANDIAPSAYIRPGERQWVRRPARAMAALLVLPMSIRPCFAIQQ